jgi:GDPmannose 4,6-dehydratase
MWFGSGLTEHNRDVIGGKVFVEANEKFYRPADVNTLLGDSSKARRVLNWQPKYDLDALVADMCAEDMKS